MNNTIKITDKYEILDDFDLNTLTNPYLPSAEGYAPLEARTRNNAPVYTFHSNAGVKKLNVQSCSPYNATHFRNRSAEITFTQNIEQKKNNIFCYYLYDCYNRPVETGDIQTTVINSHNSDSCRKMTRQDVLGLINSLPRAEVIRITYNDADPFLLPSWGRPTHKIGSVLYYPHIAAGTPSTAEGQYLIDTPWYTITYQYQPDDRISVHTVQHTTMPLIMGTDQSTVEHDLTPKDISPAADKAVAQKYCHAGAFQINRENAQSTRSVCYTTAPLLHNAAAQKDVDDHKTATNYIRIIDPPSATQHHYFSQPVSVHITGPPNLLIPLFNDT